MWFQVFEMEIQLVLEQQVSTEKIELRSIKIVFMSYKHLLENYIACDQFPVALHIYFQQTWRIMMMHRLCKTKK